jgi:hypothetical protein
MTSFPETTAPATYDGATPLHYHAPTGAIDPNRIGTVPNGVGQKKIHLPIADGSHVELTLAEYVEALRSGAIKPSNVQPIKLYELDGHVVSMDNRRLVAARLAGVKVRYKLLRHENLKPELKKVDKTWSLHEIFVRR